MKKRRISACEGSAGSSVAVIWKERGIVGVYRHRKVARPYRENDRGAIEAR